MYTKPFKNTVWYFGWTSVTSLKIIIKNLGHYVTEYRNCPAQLKVDIINECKLPTNGKPLFLFVGLVHFYHRYAPYFDICIKTLDTFLKRFYWNPIMLMAWTPVLIELFHELKKGVTYSTVLAIFGPDKPTLLKIVEYVTPFFNSWNNGHYDTEYGNCPSQLKVDIINECKLPTNGKPLFLFVGLVHFYHRYAPYFDICIKTLDTFLKRFYWNPIMLMAWTPVLIELFHELKKGVTYSTVLARFGPNKPTLLKIDWSVEGMGWILI